MAEERFLITGAYGCVGAWAVRRLVAEGVPVWTYDLPGDPHRFRLVMDDETMLQVKQVDGDITDADLFERVVVENGISHIIHLAALQVPLVRADPVGGARVNVVGTTVVLETAHRHADQVEGLVYASSFAVYGDPENYPPGPIAHDAPLTPPSLYAVFKQANEGTAAIYWREQQLYSIGLRPCVVYGPGRDQGWTSTPTKAMLAAAIGRGYRITYGSQLVFHHADDVAAAMILAARTRLEGAPVFNLGGSAAPMHEVVDAIEEVVPESQGRISYDPQVLPHPDNVDDSALNAAIPGIRWRSLVDGVRDTVEHFRGAVAAGRIDVERALEP